MLQTILQFIQITVAIGLIIVILLQAKGVGLGATFGGEGGFYRSKRGVEKLLLYLTVLLAICFVVLSIVQVILT